MRLNVPMLKRIWYRLLIGRPTDLESLSIRTLELCPGETVLLPASIYLNGFVEKIKTLSPWRSWESENQLIYGGLAHYSATTEYVIENVDIVEPFLYSGAAKAKPGYGLEHLLVSGYDNRLLFDEANLVTTWSGSHYFGSLLLDDFPLELISERHCHNISMVVKSYNHEVEYRSLLGLSETPLVRSAKIKELTIYNDPTNSKYKAERYRILRERLRASIGLDTLKHNPGVYLKRGITGERRILVNELELEFFLKDLGYDIVDISTHSAEEIARRTLNAKIVVGIEGSHLSHAIFSMADDGALIVLQPPDRFAMVYKEFTDCLGMRFAFLVGEESYGGFMIKLDDLSRILALLV